MATALEVWVARPGYVCRVDDAPWLINVFDAHMQPYEWADMSYANLPAAHGHLPAVSIPPGTYVVRATHKEKAVQSDHAIVTIRCGEVACVHLFVAGPRRRPEKPQPHDCEIRIREVTGIGQGVPASVNVTGTAAGCKEVKVILTCTSGKAREMVVPVAA